MSGWLSSGAHSGDGIALVLFGIVWYCLSIILPSKTVISASHSNNEHQYKSQPSVQQLQNCHNLTYLQHTEQIPVNVCLFLSRILLNKLCLVLGGTTRLNKKYLDLCSKMSRSLSKDTGDALRCICRKRRSVSINSPTPNALCIVLTSS